MSRIETVPGDRVQEVGAEILGHLAPGREKKFHAVEKMRSVRDRISAEIEGMTLAEELDWLAAQELDDPLLERLRATAQPPARARRTARVPCLLEP